MKKILHVIVGAGQVHYFLNAIESVKRFRAGDIAVVDRGAVLGIAPGYLVDFSKAEFHPFSKEHCVVPKGWRSAYPFWPSDTEGTEWIRRRLEYVRQNDGHLFSHIDQNQALSRDIFCRYQPGTRKILSSLVLLIANEFLRRINKHLKSGIS